MENFLKKGQEFMKSWLDESVGNAGVRPCLSLSSMFCLNSDSPVLLSGSVVDGSLPPGISHEINPKKKLEPLGVTLRTSECSEGRKVSKI